MDACSLQQGSPRNANAVIFRGGSVDQNVGAIELRGSESREVLDQALALMLSIVDVSDEESSNTEGWNLLRWSCCFCPTF